MDAKVRVADKSFFIAALQTGLKKVAEAAGGRPTNPKSDQYHAVDDQQAVTP
ncbi:MAG: hypothetical protein AAF636_16895 [Pseudomonadota bacterium]